MGGRREGGGQVGKAAQSRNFLLDPAAPHCSKASQGGRIGNAQNAMQSPKNSNMPPMQAATMHCNVVLCNAKQCFASSCGTSYWIGLHTSGFAAEESIGNAQNAMQSPKNSNTM